MNVAIVCKQSTTTSERMSTSIHHTKFSTFNNINFDNLNRNDGNKKSNNGINSRGQPHHHHLQKKYQPSQPAFGKQNRATVLMESNSVLNVVQEVDNDRRRQSFTMRDEQLLKILSAPPDEPLYINDTTNNKATININTNNDNSNSGDNLLMQFKTATSSIVAADDYENLPPADKCAAANIEDGNLDTMSSTPQKGFSAAQWNRIQRDLHSPSASCRLRAIRAIKSPANCNVYSNFDVENDENSISSTGCPVEQPRTIQEVMKDVIVYVEVRSGADNRTSGIKGVIANLGAKVNERLLRNTTHVVFKDGLQSTYNRAKSWNIPLVSILWIEACKKHLILMDPKAYPISNIEKYENPELYDKIKRQKVIQPDTLMKNLQRPIPKSKIIETLKKRDDSSSLLSVSNAPNTTVRSTSQVVHQSPWNRKTTASIVTTATATTSAKPNPSRKSLIKKPDEKPKNTIRSMFEKQLEKSRVGDSQLNGTLGGALNEMATLNISDTANEVDQTPKTKPTSEEKPDELNIVTGPLHKRVTRRNSMLMQTPSKDDTKTEVPPVSVRSSAKKRRCTMFAPSFKESIDEDDGDLVTNAKANGDDLKNGTINKTVEMDVCNNLNIVTNKSTSKVRDLLNADLLKTPRDNTSDGTVIKPVGARSNLRRKTTYTPHVMEETQVQNATVTPISTQRRKTINAKANAALELIETKSCDAILTPTSSAAPNLFSTPLIRSLSKAHVDKKTLLDEYNGTFSSKKTPSIDKRRTIANITMDIINQRIENINRNASFNQSSNDLHDDTFSNVKSTPLPGQMDKNEKVSANTTTPVSNVNETNGQTKPLKRKLFAPPSLFPDLEQQILITTPHKTDKKNLSQKRKRNDTSADDKCSTKSEEKKTLATKLKPSRKTINPRRSTMLFEDFPKRKIEPSAINSTNSTTSTLTTSSLTAPNVTPVLAFTRMHKPQQDFIAEAVQKLGKFKLENKVSQFTTHLVAIDNSRTINILRGLIRGVWILDYEWVLKSVEANHWLSETDFEMRSFSKAVEANRIERQAFGHRYRMDIFRNFEKFFLALDCACKNLKELVILCHGKVTQNITEARYFITEKHRTDLGLSKTSLQLHPNWILDSISAGKVEKFTKYIIVQ